MGNDVVIDAQAWARLQGQLSWLRAVLGILLLSMAASGVAWFVGRTDVIRTRGIVIVDAQGHDRILIGAPVPASVERKRKDAQTAAVVFLGPTGADRLIVGEAPGPAREGNAGTRVAEAMGVVLHDPQGNERGGMAFLGSGRAAVVLDRASPSGDAVGLMVDDASDFAGVLVLTPGKTDEFPAALKLGTTGSEMAIELLDSSGAKRSELKITGNQAPPAWQFSPAVPKAP